MTPILVALADGPLRYSDLGRIIAGVSQKMRFPTSRPAGIRTMPPIAPCGSTVRSGRR
jgi:hypothetical protein